MQSFLTNRQKISADKIPSEAFVLARENPDIAKVEVVSSADGQPRVELVTEGGVIRTIIVTCRCGERVELKCHY